MITATANLGSSISVSAQIRSKEAGGCADANWTLDDEDGNELNTGSIPSGGSDTIIAPNGDISINSSSVGDVLSGGNRNISVNLNGSPSGSWDGDSWEVASAAVTLALSDTTPDFGDTIILTATASNFVGTVTYTFVVRDSLGNWEKVIQSGDNNYDWAAPFAGTYDVHVIAEDGSANSSSDCVELTVGTFYVKHGIEAAFNPTDATIVSNKIDSISNRGSGAYTCSAPSASARPAIQTNPYIDKASMFCTGGNASQRRLETSFPHNPSSITIYGVFQFDARIQSGTGNAVFLLGSTDTNANNRRYSFGMDDSNVATQNVYIGVLDTLNNFTGLTAPVQFGKNVFAMTYDSTSGELDIIFNNTSYNYNESSPNSGAGNMMLLNAGFSSSRYGFPESVGEIGMKGSAVSTIDLQQIYDDLILMFPE